MTVQISHMWPCLSQAALGGYRILKSSAVPLLALALSTLDEALDSIALSGRNLCNKSCDISAMLARQQSRPPLHSEGFHHSQKGEKLEMPARGASTLLLLDCTTYVSSIYPQGVKTPKCFWLSLLTKGTSHPNQLKKQKYNCGSYDTNFLQYECICSSIFPLGSQSTILFSLYEMLLKT